MSSVLAVIRSRGSGRLRAARYEVGDVVRFGADEEYVGSIPESELPAADALQALMHPALVRLVDAEERRNEIAGEGLVMQREHLELMREDRAERARVAEKLESAFVSDPAADLDSLRGQIALDRELARAAESHAEGQPEPAPRELYAVLRDLDTAPAGWENRVKRVHLTAGAAIDHAKRLGAAHGGRFIVLKAVGYAAAAAPEFHDGAPDPDSDLSALPF